METAAGVAVLAVVIASLLIVAVVFVWAAIQDGRKDKSVQDRLGIRRRTRLGR